MAFDISRRRALKGAMGLTVGLPLLDAMLDVNGTALAATGTTVPLRFGTWFWGLGVNPSRWFPDKAGANYELKPELAPIKALQGKINILGNFNVPLDGAPNLPHISGGAAVRTGRALTADRGLPGESFDVTIGDQIGARSRFRSLEVSAIGDARNSLSGRGGGNLNPSETSASGLYARLFGLGFKDPNSGTFTPDPLTVARRSVLSDVAEQRQALQAAVGAADKQKLDQYYTSLRQLENQLEVELRKPDPLKACVVPRKPGELPVTSEIETVMLNHQLMTDLMVMALACDQTRVFNMMFNNGASNLTRIMEAWTYFVTALDGVKEGDRTLLDNMLVFAHSETEFAKFHTIDNLPMMTAGSAGGKVKTGVYVDGGGSPISRVGLTLQQVMGVSVDKWGTGSMGTTKTVSEIVA